jgi:hypothetical protein
MTLLGQSTFETSLKSLRPGARPSVLAVGEVNPYGSRPGLALWCEPRRASGDRLRRIMGLTDEQYLEHVARINLCDEKKWNAELVRRRFNSVDRTGVGVIVLLGARVREALMGPPPFEILSVPCAATWFVGLPHPSGRCRAWNDAGAARRARAILESLAPEIPWGTAEDRM